MNIRNSQILVASISKVINKSKLTGYLDTKSIYIFKLLDYYINFTQSTIDNGSELYIIANTFLKNYIREFSYSNSSTICNYKITTGSELLNVHDPNINNTAPTVSSSAIDFEQNTVYTFKVADFTVSFNDIDGDSYKNLIIYLDETIGTFIYNGIEVSGTIEIPVDNVVNLVFNRPGIIDYNDPILFRISDDNQNSLFSTITLIPFSGDLITDNQESTIGDNTIYVDNRVTTILTLEMFTSQLTPPYNDPENDLIDSIRIDEISSANKGTYYFNNIEIILGQIITREDLQADLFTHIGYDIDIISSDVINFSARDEGSQIWVQ